MFQDKAGPLDLLRHRLSGDAEDVDAGELAGGGGGPEPQEEPGVAAPSPEEEAVETVEAVAEEEDQPAAEPTEAPETHESSDIDEFAAAMAVDDDTFARSMGGGAAGSGYQPLREGDVIKGTVVHIDREGVLVDVGTKTEGIIRLNELSSSRDAAQRPEDVVKVGEVISVYVLGAETSEGHPLLSKKRADFEVAWERVEEAHKSGVMITAMVTDRVKGGLVVDLGIRGFVPASHVGSGKVKNLDKFVGQSLPLKVIEVDRYNKKVVLSHRLAVEEEREKKRAETLENLAEGQVRTGIVRRITEYGAFVDLGGIDGLLHISEMSWTRINHPSEAVKVGQKIQVMVLKMNLDSGRVSLGMRQILPDPWQGVSERFRVGDIVKGKISRLVPFGAFVHLEEGVEAIVPNNELSNRRVKKPDMVVNIGDEVEAKVIDVREEERRMTLSMRAVMPDREEPMMVPSEPRIDTREPRGGGHSQREAPRTTIADLIGGEAFAEKRAQLEREFELEPKVKAGKRRKEKARAAERAEEEAYGDLSDEELLELAVDTEAEELDLGDGADDVAAGGETAEVGDIEESAEDGDAEQPDPAAEEEQA